MRLGDHGSAAAERLPLTLIQPETDEVVDPHLVYDWSDKL